MAKNWIGREDPFLDNERVVYGGFPSVEGAVQSLTGVALPFVDLSRGKGIAPLVSNAATVGEGVLRRLSSAPSMPPAENALMPQGPVQEDRIRQLRDAYLAEQRMAAGRGKAINPSQE
jgi:hypothetical protein